MNPYQSPSRAFLSINVINKFEHNIGMTLTFLTSDTPPPIVNTFAILQSEVAEMRQIIIFSSLTDEKSSNEMSS